MTSTETPRTAGIGLLRTVTLVVAVFAALACLAAAWFGIAWFRTAHDESIALGMARDAVLRDAQQVAINVNTLDNRNVQAGLDLWAESATGTALEEFRKNRDTYVRTVTESKTSSTARVRDGAVADLNDRTGTARVLVGVDVTYTTEQRSDSCIRQRLQLEMKRTPKGWKVARLAPIGSLDPVPGACASAGRADSPPN